MTDAQLQQLDEKRPLIEGAEDYQETIETTPNQFYGEIVLSKTISSQTVGYAIKELYTWTDVYNTDGVLGGKVISNIDLELIDLSTGGVV